MPAGSHTLYGERRRACRGKHGCHRSRSTSAANLPRRSRDRGASRTPPLTGDCETNVAGYMTTDWVISRPTKGARAVPAGLNTLDGRRRRAHRGKHGCHRSRRTGAPNPPRQSHNHGAPRTVHPTAVSETNVAAYDATGVEDYTSTARPPHGSAETYPHATTVGGGVPDAPCVG